ncbi:MAG: recombinase RecT [Thermoguttaceae bacterium]|nr:recombinase RecT [Thermoguttaceae bacterium]
MNQNAMTMSRNSVDEAIDMRKKTIFQMVPQFQKALPDFFKPDRFARICCNLLVAKDHKDRDRVNKLLACSPNTFFGALLACAQLGLEPDGLLGQAYLIPYGNTIQLILGYRGLIDLARRSGELTSLIAHAVHENDAFSFDFGTGELPHHTFDLRMPRGEVIAFYAIARFKDGSYHFDLMTREEVDAIRNRSKGGNNGPWVTDYEEMGRKTIIRRIAKYLPMNVQKACIYDGRSVGVDSNGEMLVTDIVEPETSSGKFESARQQLIEAEPVHSECIEDAEEDVPRQEKKRTEKNKPTRKEIAPIPQESDSQNRDFDYYSKTIREAESKVQLTSLRRQFSLDCENGVFDDGDYITLDNLFMVREEELGKQKT